MTALYGCGLAALVFLLAVFYLLSAGQALHSIAVLYRRGVRFLPAITAYELLLVCHLALFVLVLTAASHGWAPPVAAFGKRYWPVEPMLWLNVAPLLLGLVLCVRLRRPAMLAELVFTAASLPPIVSAMGDAFPVFLLVDMMFFSFRTIASLMFDVASLRANVSRMAAVEALKVLPEGIACADRRGRVLLMNDAMRTCLRALGLPTDLADMRVLYPVLEQRAHGSLEEGIRLAVPERGTWLFVADDVMLGWKRTRRIVAFDITEECQAEAALAVANEKLESAGFELAAWMEHVQESAENEALIHMHSHVHDVIGQRLSLLHRCLEDGDLTDERLAVVRPALADILEDLASVDKVDCRAELESVVAALASVDVEVFVEGELPQDARVAGIVVDVIREASTNAVRHARARHIDVALRVRDSAIMHVVISNDGEPCAEVLRAGTGMRGMRHAAEEAGGSFSFRCGPPFTVEVELPLPDVIAIDTKGVRAEIVAVEANGSK